MKRTCLLTGTMLALSLGSTPDARARTGLGVILNEPTGLSYKQYLGRRSAIDGAFTWAYGADDDVYLHLDYLHHGFKISASNGATLPIYLGFGGRLILENETRFGIRFPVGGLLELSTLPIDVFLELVPTLDLSPDSDLSLPWAVGVRYFFR